MRERLEALYCRVMGRPLPRRLRERQDFDAEGEELRCTRSESIARLRSVDAEVRAHSRGGG